MRKSWVFIPLIAPPPSHLSMVIFISTEGIKKEYVSAAESAARSAAIARSAADVMVTNP